MYIEVSMKTKIKITTNNLKTKVIIKVNQEIEIIECVL